MVLVSEELDLIDREAKKEAKDGQKKAWDVYQGTIVSLKDKALPAVENSYSICKNPAGINEEIEKLSRLLLLLRKKFSIY
jgi:hypothetical protein